MAAKRNYLLGHGEKLARNELVKIGFGEGTAPYTFGEAKAFVSQRIAAVAKTIDLLPAIACPNDEAVAAITLHPKYLSKSAHPNDFLKATGLRAVGSKAVVVTPRKSHLSSAPSPSASAELFVAGSRQSFRDLSATISQWSPTSTGAADLIKIESIRTQKPSERIKPIHSKGRNILFEIVIHAGEDRRSTYVLDAFKAYLASLEIEVDLDGRIDADELSFVPVRAARERIDEIAEFPFLRVAREMPRLREFSPSNTADIPKRKCFPSIFPAGDALDPTIRVAIFDGGQPNIPTMRKWVRRIDGDGVVAPVEEYLSHGCAVTSALLFGSLDSASPPETPYARVDHYRVLDANTEHEPQESLYPVLKRIISVLERESYDFVSFSIGPSIPVDDDDIHPWTAKIDPLLASGETLATIAAGNSGRADAATRLNRIQPPSDCVNALSIGASDGTDNDWERAPYSSVGHGRCPGVMKPDGVAFGGTADEPFWVIDAGNPAVTAPVTGTSFASPAALRAAIGVRAHIGAAIRPLALKALLIHNAHTNDHHASEVGWGLLCTDVEQLITCVEGSATVVYQGELDPKKFLRATIPMPAKTIAGLVTISATICIATQTDPQHPLTYTRSGLQIFFRKDRLNVAAGKTNPKSSGFFKSGLGMPEQLIRNDAHQWETVRHHSKRMQGNDLKNPCFDIHFNPREEGHDAKGEKIPYAMIVTVSAPKVKDMFDQVFNRYKFQLAELKPQIELPVRLG